MERPGKKRGSVFVLPLILMAMQISSFPTLLVEATMEGGLQQVVGQCESITVVATSFPKIDGCYTRSISLETEFENSIPVYTKMGGEPILRIAGWKMVREPSSNRHERLGWIIGEVYDPGLDMVIDEVRRPLCRANTDMEMFNLPTAAQNWKCDVDGDGIFTLRESFQSLTCGCSGLDVVGASAGRDGGGGGGGGVAKDASSSSIRINSNKPRGSLRSSNAPNISRSISETPNTEVEDSDSNLNAGEVSSFWSWLVISAGVIGLIALCCVGWYIRNPWCKRQPPPDPTATTEDAAPQAPASAFQPWGASAPPK